MSTDRLSFVLSCIGFATVVIMQRHVAIDLHDVGNQVCLLFNEATAIDLALSFTVLVIVMLSFETVSPDSLDS